MRSSLKTVKYALRPGYEEYGGFHGHHSKMIESSLGKTGIQVEPTSCRIGSLNRCKPRFPA